VKKRIVVPTVDENGLKSQLSGHFGRSPYFAVVDVDDSDKVSNVKSVPNVGEHCGGTGQTHENILELHPNAIIVCGMGPRGLNTFQNAGIAVLKAKGDNVGEVIDAYQKNQLEVLIEGCHEAHHHQ
jgi:predicted Fe-Mo cluster-binding NifX family protein